MHTNLFYFLWETSALNEKETKDLICLERNGSLKNIFDFKKNKGHKVFFFKKYSIQNQYRRHKTPFTQTAAVEQIGLQIFHLYKQVTRLTWVPIQLGKRQLIHFQDHRKILQGNILGVVRLKLKFHSILCFTIYHISFDNQTFILNLT